MTTPNPNTIDLHHFYDACATYILCAMIILLSIIVPYIVLRVLFTRHTMVKHIEQSTETLIEKSDEHTITSPELPMPTEAYGEIEQLKDQATSPYPATMPEPEVVVFREPIAITRAPRRRSRTPIVDVRRDDQPETEPRRES